MTVQEDPVLAYCGSFRLLQDMPILDVSSLWFFKGMGQLGYTEVGEITISAFPAYNFSPDVVFPLDRDLGVLLPCQRLCLVLICLQLFWALVLVVPLLVAVVSLHILEVSIFVQ